jgi:hypothetical protein
MVRTYEVVAMEQDPNSEGTTEIWEKRFQADGAQSTFQRPIFVLEP